MILFSQEEFEAKMQALVSIGFPYHIAYKKVIAEETKLIAEAAEPAEMDTDYRDSD